MSNQTEKKLAEDIMKTVRRLQLPYKLDVPTEGKGNCFPLAVIAQCKRPEIYRNLTKLTKKIINLDDPTVLRKAVRTLMINPRQKHIEEYKRNYEEILSVSDKRSWAMYWDIMIRNYEWVDQIFVQATAWFLQHDIWIILTSATEKSPHIIIRSNPNEGNEFKGEPLIIGCKSNVHYQSLLPLREGVTDSVKCAPYTRMTEVKADTVKRCENDSNMTIFQYEHGNNVTYFEILPDKKIRCPYCNLVFKNIHAHFQRSSCKMSTLNDLTEKLNAFKRNHFREDMKKAHRERIYKFRAAQREKDNEKVKRDQIKWKVKSDGIKRFHDNAKVKANQKERKEVSRNRLRLMDNEKVKAKQNKWKLKSDSRLRLVDNVKFKGDQNKRKKLSRMKRKVEDADGLSALENEAQKKRLKNWSEQDRLREFRKATQYNAIFICNCCHRRLFNENVEMITRKLIDSLENVSPGIFKKCTGEEITTPINGRNDCYICKTCISHMKAKRMPPMSVKNKLELEKQDEKHVLTELEGNLIAKSILFSKIHQLPKSRWTVLKDKVINIPINDSDIINTIKQLPRTPKDAQLIGVALKRKMEFKNKHARQLINPKKVIDMLDLLKRSGNPYYQFHESLDQFKKRCEIEDPEGYRLLFPDEIEGQVTESLHADIPVVVDEKEYENFQLKEDELEEQNVDEEGNGELDDELDFIANDPIRQYQFNYNESLCMTNKYPEIEVEDTTKDIEVAPGEGKRPYDILQDSDWDIKAFPHLHNPNGKNGMDEERITKLTDHNYFIQRILNYDQRFAKSPTYKYAAVSFIEKKQLQRNINIVGTRGKKVSHGEGKVTYELEDSYAVLEDIKNTPRYWKKVKHEMIAKLENLGAFQIFFTLSCADLRWEENFAAILRDEGLNLTYSLVADEKGYIDTRIEVEYMQNNEKRTMLLKQYIEEFMDKSLHELIRGNVLLATRYFNQRVKKFISKIVMGHNNPMNVQYYTYKVEFQERGAGHIHGTLWLDLDKLEKLQRLQNGKLKSSEQIPDSSEKEVYKPFESITSAFKNIKNGQGIDLQEKEALTNFVDEFTTVSTNIHTVGEQVSKIVLDVNKHNHTKACRKYDTSCRFNFPRYPSIRTIIAEPIADLTDQEKKEKLKAQTEILKKVGEVLNDEELINDIVERIGQSEFESVQTYRLNKKRRIEAVLEKAEVTLTEYENALSFTRVGYLVIHERDVTEIYINTYNIEWIRAWNGNIDVSPCFDYHSVITYISDYWAKDDTGLMEVINAIIQQLPSETLKEQMRQIANTFLTHRQIGEAEACYRLLPNLVLKNSNVACQWLSIGKQSELSKRWKQASKEDIEKGVGLVEINQREGYWVEQSDMLSKYLRRPDDLEMISASQFAKMYTSSTFKGRKMDDTNIEEDNDDIAEHEEYVHQGLDFIVMGKEGLIKLPNYIRLKDPLHGEPKWMHKRRQPAVLRYHKVNKENKYDSWMLNELMLYTPFRSNDLNCYENKSAQIYQQKREWIQIVKSRVMEHLENVEEARYMVEQSTKEVDLDEVGNALDATYEQDQSDSRLEGATEHPDYIHLDVDGILHSDENKGANSIFKHIAVPELKELKQETKKLDEYQRKVLDIAIKYAKDVVKARRDGNNAPKPIYLLGHGGAGAGKSMVINLVAKWCHKILVKEGDDIDTPYIIKTAFTGTAASNIDGQTLHTSFAFNFDNKHYSLSDKKRDEKRNLFKNLRIIVIDEVSMLKADMLYQLDLKLQEIKERVGVPFGGVSILAFGDLLQLRPVLGAFPFEKPKNPEFHATFELNNRWEMFQVLNLEINHRQGKDKQYADMLNRMRVGEMTDEDIEMLKTRVRHKNHPDLQNVGLYIIPTRKACARYNAEHLNSLKGDEILLKAVHFHPTQKNYNPFIEEKEGAIGSTSFLDKIRLKLGSKIILIHNIDTTDGLTNGQLGTLISIIKTRDNKVDKLIIKLEKEDAGKENRKKYASISKIYPGTITVERVSVNYSIRKKGGVIGSTATLIQFPIKPAHAISAHKIQGQTIPKPIKVGFDTETIFEEAQGYVMFSRVQELDQVYIIGAFNPDKIYPSKKALKELERLNKVSINSNPTVWNQIESQEIRILSMNCAGIKHHYKDIQRDATVLKADAIHFLEISLDSQDDDDQFPLDGYTKNFSKAGAGKGIGTYYKSEKFDMGIKIVEEKFQVATCRTETVDVIGIYRSQLGKMDELLKRLSMIIDKNRVTLVLGDFNLCYYENNSNRLIKGLESIGFQQLVHEPTHIRGRFIDHAYLHDPTGAVIATVERYSAYYSDHDAICIHLKSQNTKTISTM